MNEQSTNPEQDFGAYLEAAVRTVSNTRGEPTENQDNFCLIDSQGLAKIMKDHQEQYLSVQNWPKGHIRLAVMDGIGGHAQGRQVAEETARRLTQIPACQDIETLSAELTLVHTQLRKEFNSPKSSPGCTLTLVEIPPDKPAMLFHVGDSRLYYINTDTDCLTIDHVPATQLLMNGQIDEDQWKQRVYKETRFELCQAFVLGNNFMDVNQLDESLLALTDKNLPDCLHSLQDRRTFSLEKNGVYLLATDGIWCQNDPQAFISTWPELLNKPERPIQPLVDDLLVALILGATEDQHQDNATAILFRCKQPEKF